MKKIPAWLEVDSNELPGYISSMVFSGSQSTSEWQLVAVSRSNGEPDQAPIGFSAEGSALVRFELPGSTRCISGKRPESVVMLSDLFDPDQTIAESPLEHIWVACLPAIHAKEVLFANDVSAKGFESNLKRFLPGRGGWLKCRVIAGSAQSDVQLSGLGPPPDIADNPTPVRQEKLAAAIATAMLFGRIDLGSDRTVTFDIGTVALMRQIISGDWTMPDRKSLLSDCKLLVKQLLQAARQQDIKPGSVPRKIPEGEAGALQLARVLSSSRMGSLSDSEDLLSLLPASPDQLDDSSESLDQSLLGLILQNLLELDYFPSISDVLAILKAAVNRLRSQSANRSTDSREELEALEMLMANVESPEDRIDRFRERFEKFPGLVGTAHVFWGWSEKPEDNFEHRVAALKSVSRPAHQIANMVFAAAGGGGRLPPRFFQSELWTTTYRCTWDQLLSRPSGESPKISDKDLWTCEGSELRLTDRGPAVKIRLESSRIPLGLQIADQLLLVQTVALKLLTAQDLASKVADAVLAASDGDTSHFSKDMKSLIDVTLTVRIGKNSTGEIAGPNIIFRNIRESDLNFDHRWSDSVLAARKLTQGKALSRILEGISNSRLEELGSQLTAWSERQSL